MEKKPSILKTERLLLRPWKKEDFNAFAKLNADPEVRKFFPSTLNLEESNRLAEKISSAIEKQGWGFWAVSIPRVAEFIGFIGLAPIEFQAPFAPAVEIGWRLAYDFWGKGYALEGAKAALQYGFETLGLNEIVAFTAPENIRSRRLMLRLGMQYTQKDDFEHPQWPKNSPLRKQVLYRLPKTEWNSYQNRDIRVDNSKLHTESFGTPSQNCCLLISGAMSSARSWTGPFCKKLQQNQFFTLRYDHRDVGESSSVDWKKDPYSISDLAKDAIRILDAYGIEKAHAIGHSMGGYICQQLAIEFPHRLHSIATIGSGPLGATKETDQPLTLKEQATLFQTWHLLMKEKKASTLEEEVESFCHVWRHLNGKIPLDEEMAKDYTRDLLIRTNHPIQKGNNHQLLMQDLLDSLGKRRDILQKIQLPTLVIHGEEDPLILPRMGKALAHAIEGAKLTMIPRMGHMFLNRELESELSQLLCNHLKKIL